MVLLGVLLIWIVSLCLHEYAHARVAYAGGDHTVADKGYLSMNPLRYMNPMTSIVLPALFVAMGWLALPGGAVWIETHRLRSRGWQSAVSLAGPAANVLMCVALGLPFLLTGGERSTTMWLILAASCYWQAIAVVLNLLPIPGLDGFGAIEPWLPREAREWANRFKPYGFFLIIVLFIGVPAFGRTFSNGVGAIIESLGISRLEAYTALDAMMFWRK
jgi:Zn-dependent protease